MMLVSYADIDSDLICNIINYVAVIGVKEEAGIIINTVFRTRKTFIYTILSFFLLTLIIPALQVSFVRAVSGDSPEAAPDERIGTVLFYNFTLSVITDKLEDAEGSEQYKASKYVRLPRVGFRFGEVLIKTNFFPYAGHFSPAALFSADSHQFLHGKLISFQHEKDGML